MLVITLNRPQSRNAVNAAMAAAIAAALERLDGDDDLRVGILTGAGGSFCAGFDLKAFLAGERATIPGRGFAGIVERPPAKPLIAAVEGYALAGGFEIVLACDLVVAAQGARFGLPEVKRGLLATGGGLLRLPERIPYHHAMEIALTGEAISAARASELGLINRLVEDGQALAQARALAGRDRRPRPARAACRQAGDRAVAAVAARRALRAPDAVRGRRSWPPRTRARARPRSPRSARRAGRAAEPPRPPRRPVGLARWPRRRRCAGTRSAPANHAAKLARRRASTSSTRIPPGEL